MLASISLRLSRACALGCVLGLALPGCSSKSSGPAKQASKQASKQATKNKKKAEVPLATREGEKGKWLIASTGSRVAPPIKIEEVPDGAWYCDMGTVHYAQSERGDETCKLCKMKLIHKVAKAAQ